MKKTLLSSANWHKRFLQQALWTTSIRNYLFKFGAITLESRILEVGCGTCAVISQLPIESNYRFGIDINRDYIEFSQIEYDHLHLVQGDGHLLPYSANSFDLVYCHYLLLWVKSPERILHELVRVGKPGAKIFILAEPDYGGRIDFPPTLEALGKAQTESLELQGADPFIGRKLTTFATAAGIEIVEYGVLGSQSSPYPDQGYLESEWEMLKFDLSGQLNDSEISQLLQIDMQAWSEGTRVLFIPTFFLYGEIK